MAADEQTSDVQEETGNKPEPPPVFSNDTETMKRVLAQLGRMAA